MVQLFWGCFFDDVFIPFETSNFDPFLFLKLYDLDDPSPIQLPIQNPEHSPQLHLAIKNQLHKKILFIISWKNFISYPLIVWGCGGRGWGGGLLITTPHYFPKSTALECFAFSCCIWILSLSRLIYTPCWLQSWWLCRRFLRNYSPNTRDWHSTKDNLKVKVQRDRHMWMHMWPLPGHSWRRCSRISRGVDSLPLSIRFLSQEGFGKAMVWTTSSIFDLQHLNKE